MEKTTIFQGDPSERNPICPYALRFSDISIGAKFVGISIGEMQREGIFISKPYYDDKYGGWKVTVKYSDGEIDNVYLTDSGIIKNLAGHPWNDINFMISGTAKTKEDYRKWHRKHGRFMFTLLKETVNERIKEEERSSYFSYEDNETRNDENA